MRIHNTTLKLKVPVLSIEMDLSEVQGADNKLNSFESRYLGNG